MKLCNICAESEHQCIRMFWFPDRYSDAAGELRRSRIVPHHNSFTRKIVLQFFSVSVDPKRVYEKMCAKGNQVTYLTRRKLE